MISSLQGHIGSTHHNTIEIITPSGVGYEVHVSAPFFLELKDGQEIQLHTYLKVGENIMELFGFRDAEEKYFFEQLISVNGVGPRTAMNILGLGSLDSIQDAIGRGDVSYLTGVSGIGKKTAERIVVELKGKVGRGTGDGGREEHSDMLSEVVEALVSMGYSKEEARMRVKNLDENKPVEDLLRDALKHS